MRVNIYAEEMTDRVELVTKTTVDGDFTGVRFYLYLPVSIGEGGEVKGPFKHRMFDDDSAAVTFWGKGKLRAMLVEALHLLDRQEEQNFTVMAEAETVNEKEENR